MNNIKQKNIIHFFQQLQAEFSKAYSSDRKNEILQELEKLKQQALNATPSELLIIEARIEELNKELEQVETLMDIQVDEEARTTGEIDTIL